MPKTRLPAQGTDYQCAGRDLARQRMAMTAKLWTISGLAAELDRDRRTITRALRDVPHDGK